MLGVVVLVAPDVMLLVAVPLTNRPDASEPDSKAGP